LSLTCLKRSRSRMTTQNLFASDAPFDALFNVYGDWRCRSANLAKQAAQRLLVWSRRWRLRFAVVRPSFYCLTPSDRRKFQFGRLFHQGRANFCQVVKVGDGVQPSGEFAEMVSVTMIAVAHRLSGARQHEKKFFDLVGFSFEIFGRAFSPLPSRSSTWPSVSLISGTVSFKQREDAPGWPERVASPNHWPGRREPRCFPWPAAQRDRIPAPPRIDRSQGAGAVAAGLVACRDTSSEKSKRTLHE